MTCTKLWEPPARRNCGKPNGAFTVLVLGLFAMLCLSSAAEAQQIDAVNTANYLGGGRWAWTIYIDAPREVIGRIKSVEYTLHPTFPNPVRTVSQVGDAQHPFGLTTEGWGTFVVSVKVMFVNGKTTNLKHMLSFTEQPARAASADRLPALSVDNVATRLGEGFWEWTAFVQGPPETLRQIKCVRYTLHPTFPNPIREVCNRGSGPRAFSLTTTGWGTFPLKIHVFFADGKTADFTHNLKF